MVEYKYQELTGNIINAAHAVHNKLGYGFLEKVYHNSLLIELQERDLQVETQKPIKVYYNNQIVGDFFADLVVENKVIVEVKSYDKYLAVFEAQLLNYLKAADFKVGLIINFGPSVQVKRMVL